MLLIEDTRQKANKHKNISSYCKAKGIKMCQLTLQVGDYMLGCLSNGEIKPMGRISVDTKQDIEELANDLLRDEFSLNKKYRKCYEQGIRLIVLIEEPYKDIKDIIKWKSKHSTMSGRKLVDKIYRLKFSYNVEFMFCDKKDTAKTIVKLLNKE